VSASIAIEDMQWQSVAAAEDKEAGVEQLRRLGDHFILRIFFRPFLAVASCRIAAMGGMARPTYK
jgi:hypothetical protein